MATLVMCSNASCGELFDVPEGQTDVCCPSCGTCQKIAATDSAKPAAPPPQADQPPAKGSESSSSAEATGQGDEAMELPLAEEPGDQPPDGAPGDKQAPPAKQRPAAPEPPAGFDPDEIDLSPLADLPSERRGSPSIPPAPAEPPTRRPMDETSDWQWSTQFEELIDTPPVAHDAAEGPSDDVLENRLAGPAIFGLGLAGMLAGLLTGLLGFESDSLLPAYLGAVVGWIAGFVISFLVLLAAEGSHPERAFCPTCGATYPPEYETCSWCGGMLELGRINPLTSQGMAAATYARSNGLALAWSIMVLLLVAVLLAGGAKVLGSWPAQTQAQWGVAMKAAGGLIALLLVGFIAAWGFRTVSQTVRLVGSNPPSPPSPLSIESIVGAFKLLLAAAVYVLPVFTLPLLPLGLMAMGVGRLRAFDPRVALRTAWGHPRDFAILWLLLLLWSAALTLGISVAMAMFMLVEKLTAVAGAAQGVAEFVMTVLQATVYGAMVILFSLAMFRCIGVFARQNARHQGRAAPTRK